MPAARSCREMRNGSTASMTNRKSGVITGEDRVARCWWSAGDPAYEPYHDLEWGRPVGDDRRLFETMCLEGFQAGLSWLTILRKREHFRRAFHAFDIPAVARFNAGSIDRLLGDAGIVRHRAKIEAVVTNARRCLDLIDEVGSLAAYVWAYEPNPRSRPRRLDRAALMRLTTSDEAAAMSKDLKRRGWAFVGPTTLYAFMQAMGLVNDHVDACHFRGIVERARADFARPRPVK
jgi:DNA-3-methyladenine glycosylase I